MKTTLEIIDSLPIGSVVPKTILARMKRAGVISSYSWYGYLEGATFSLPSIIEYKGRYFKKKYLDGCFKPYLIKADIVPRKRKDYEQFKGDFGKKISSDMLIANAWNLHLKLNMNRNKIYRYLENKKIVIGNCISIRARKDIREPRMCLWGAIV